jgi:hypothetical protein
MTLNIGKVRKIILLGLAAAFAVTFVWYLYLWSAYYKTLPRFPDKATGSVYADNFHGFVRYETHQQYVRLHTLERCGEALVIVTILAGALSDPDYWQKMGWRYPGSRRARPGRSSESGGRHGESERS